MPSKISGQGTLSMEEGLILFSTPSGFKWTKTVPSKIN